MITVPINTTNPYNVHIGYNILPTIGEHIKTLLPHTQKVAIITDETVAALYLKQTLASLAYADLTPHVCTLPPGESTKSGAQYLALLNFLTERGLTRSDCALALGGGVIGDLSGFAAATFQRGIPLVQVPTTLLSMVDSSVGGKTAINLPGGKNMAGTFHQPTFVLCDTKTLETLQAINFQEGIAEIIKYGMIRSTSLLETLRKDDIYNISETLPAVIEACVKIKCDLVVGDEFDHGHRRLLNLGHTIGHAIEHLCAYKMTHGHAIAIGMTIDTRAAVTKQLCPQDCLTQLEHLLTRYHLPTHTNYSAKVLYNVAKTDKKRTGSKITIAAPRHFGHSELLELPVEALLDWITSGVQS